MILQTSDFLGEYAIGQYQLNEPLLQDYINNHEADFFLTFFERGYYADLSARLASADTAIKTAAEAELAEFKTALIAYVWLYYTSREQEKLTGAGLTLQDETNATTVNMDYQCRRVFNEMIMKLRRVSVNNDKIIKWRLRLRNALEIY